MPRIWTAEAVVSAIKTLQDNGEALDLTSINQAHRNLLWAATKYHGTWRKAVEACGIEYSSVSRIAIDRQSWDKEKIIATLKSLYEQGLPLNSNYVQTKQQRLFGAATKYFGGWPQTVEAAGLNYDRLRKVKLRNWSIEVIIEAVIHRAHSEKSISGAVVYEEDRGLYQAAKRHLGKGGWAKARVLAGFAPIDPDPKRKWTEKSVTEEIQRLHANGVQLYTQALQRSEFSYILAAGRKVFGTWACAIERASLNYAEIRKGRKNFWTREEVLRGIKGLEAQGVRLSLKEVRVGRSGLIAAAIKYFGCWSQAVEAAGIQYRLHCQTWSTKAWLRRMHVDEYNATLETSRTLAKKRRMQ
ncbi:MAG: hypothetical protein ABIT47_00745 [Candidatus Paceibacterota bacterium]